MQKTTNTNGAPMGPTLGGLASQYDAIDHVELEKQLAADQALDERCRAALDARLALAEQMKMLLGEHYDEFDRRYGEIVKAQPAHLTPAQTAVSQVLFDLA